MKSLWTALFLLLLAGALVTGCRPPGPSALLKGKDLLDQGQFKEAALHLRTATTLLPTNAHAFNYLGVALHQNGQTAEAEKCYLRALALNHELAEARFNLGCLFLSQNKLEQAKSELTAFTLRRTHAPEGWIKLGTAQLRSRESAAAERSFSQALRLSVNDPEALTGIGLARAQRNRPVEAIQRFREALKKQPDYAPALLNLAIVAQEQLKDKKLALANYRTYLRLKPTPPNAVAVQRVVSQLELELAPSPAPVAIAARPNQQTPAAATNLPTTAFKETLPPLPAKKNLDLQAPAAPSQKSTNVGVGQLVASPAPKPVTAPQTSAPTTAKVESTRAPSAPASNLVSASTIKTSTVANKPSPSQTTSNPPKPVIHAAPTVVRPPPSSPTTALEVVQVPADTVFKPAQGVPAPFSGAGTSPSPRTQSTGKLATDTTRTSPSPQAAAQPVVPAPKPAKGGFFQKINPVRLFGSEDKSAGSNIDTARVAARTKKPISADAPQSVSPAFKRYQYLSPAKPLAGNRMEAERSYAQGVQAERARKPGEAIEAYRRAIQLDPAYFDAYYNLGVANAEAGNLPSALAAYEGALAIRPESLDARYNFALALKQANFPVDAANELHGILIVFPDESRAHLALGNLYAQQLRQPARAREHYLKVLSTDPANPQAGAIRYWLTDNP